MLSLLGISRSAPQVLSAAEAEQWLFRHDQYLTEHSDKELNIGKYYPDLAGKEPGEQRKGLILIFKEALARRWFDYQNEEWSVGIEARNPRINIAEVFPALADYDSRRDTQKKAVQLWLEKQEQLRAMPAQAPEAVSSPAAAPTAKEESKQAADEGDGDDSYEVVQPEQQAAGAANGVEPQPNHAPAHVQPQAAQPQAGAYPALVPDAQANAAPALALPPKHPYIPRMPFTCCIHPQTPVEIGQIAPQQPASSGILSRLFGSPAPVVEAVEVPEVDTSAAERQLGLDLAQKNQSEAIRDFVAAMRTVAPPGSFKVRIAFYEKAVETALRHQEIRPREMEIRSLFCLAFFDDFARLVREAYLDSEVDATALINAFLGLKPDLFRLRKGDFIATTPERLLIERALGTNLTTFTVPMLELKDAFFRYRSESSYSLETAAVLSSYRLKWSQWAWALQQTGLVPLPQDFYRSAEPRSFLMQASAAAAPSAPSSGEARAPRRAAERAPKRDMKSYIAVQFADVEANGEMLKKMVSVGKYYRLLKLALAENNPNPWSSALWEYERQVKDKFDAVSTVYNMEKTVLQPLLRSYKDQELIQAVYKVVRAVEADHPHKDIQKLIAAIPDKFFPDEKFVQYVAAQARAEGVEINFQAPGWMDNLLHTPIIAQAIVAWFDNRLTAYSNKFGIQLP